jgi:hypothetical protein
MMALIVVAALAAAPCELPSTLELTDRQAEALCGLSVEPAAKAQTALAAIYERPGFEQARAPQPGDALKRLRAWLESIFETAGAETYSNLTRVAVLVAAALGALALVVRLARRRRGPGPRAPSSAEVVALALADPTEHLARARSLTSAEPRAATREGLLALLSALERQRLARPDRVKTNREIVDELPGRGAPGAVVEAVRAQLGWFDRAWYSVTPLDAASARRFIDEVQGVVERIAGLSPEPRR